MKIEVIPGNALSADLLQQWRSLRSGRPDLCSPFLAPEFVQAVAEVRGNVEVIVVSVGKEVWAIIPFYRHRRTVALPIADTFSDVEGAIIRPGARLHVKALMRTAGLTSWRFRRWLADQEIINDYTVYRYKNPVVNLCQGWQIYYAHRQASGTEFFSKTERIKRKILREKGDLRLEFHTNDLSYLDTILEWKSRWAKERGYYNSIGLPWHKPLLSRLMRHKTATFSAGSSLLFVADQMLAGTFWLRDESCGSLLISGFNPEYSRYSPGSLWYYEFLRAAPEHQLYRIELGEGSERHKAQIANDAVLVAEGMVARWPVFAGMYRSWLRAKRWFRESSWTQPMYQWSQRVRAWSQHVRTTN